MCLIENENIQFNKHGVRHFLKPKKYTQRKKDQLVLLFLILTFVNTIKELMLMRTIESIAFPSDFIKLNLLQYLES